MEKEMLKTLSLAAAVTATGLVATSAQAEETTVPVAEETSERTVTAEELKTQEGVVAEAKTDMDAAATTVATDQAAVDSATADVNTAEMTLAATEVTLVDAKETAKEATPEAISKADEAITEKTLEVSSAQEKVNQEQDKVNTQAKVVEEAKTATAKEQAEVNAAQKDVDAAQASFDSEVITKTQADLSKLEKDLETEQTAVDDLKAAISATEAEQATLASSGATKRKELENAVTAAGSPTISETIEHELAKDELEESEYISEPRSEEDSSWVGKDGKTYYNVSNENIEFDGEKTETIVLQSEKEFKESQTVDYTKLSQYVRDYIVQLRAINGIDIPVPEVTDKALAWAKARTDEMAKNNVLSHDTNLDPSDFGLLDENENATSGGVMTSTLDEKHIAYDLLLRYFNDYRNANLYGAEDPTDANVMNYGHRIFLLGGSGTGFAVQATGGYGVLSFVTDDSSKRVYPGFFDADAENKDSDSKRSEFYFKGKRVKFLPKTTFRYVWNETVTRPNEAYSKAVSALEEFNTQQASVEKATAEKLANQNSDLTDAQNTLTATKKAISDTTEKIRALTTDNETKVKALETAQSKLATQQAELELAQANLSKEQEKLTQLETIKKQSDSVLATLTEELTKLKADKDHFLSAQANLEAAQKAYDEAAAGKNVADQKLEVVKAKLEASKYAYDEVKAVYDKEKAIYDAMVLEKAKADEVAHLAALQAKKDQLIADGKTPVAVYENGVIVDYVTERPRPILNSNEQTSTDTGKVIQTAINQKITRDETQKVLTRRQSQETYEAKLPNTGEASSATYMLIGASLIALAAGTRKRRQG